MVSVVQVIYQVWFAFAVCFRSLGLPISGMEMTNFRCILGWFLESIYFYERRWELFFNFGGATFAAWWFDPLVGTISVLKAIWYQKTFREIELRCFFLAFGCGPWLCFYFSCELLIGEICRKRAYLSFKVDGSTPLFGLIVLHNHYWITFHIFIIINNLTSLYSLFIVTHFAWLI